MRLSTHITFRISVVVGIVLLLWAGFFYFAITDEINDETDDALEDYSEMLIARALAGEKLPEVDNGSNNQYYIEALSPAMAASLPVVRYSDTLVYIPAKHETEPARAYSAVYKDRHGVYYRLHVFTPTFEKDDLIQSILMWIIILYSGLLLAIIGVNLWVFYGSMRPFYRLLKWLDEVRPGGRPAELKNETSIREFQKLNEAALRYTSRMEEVFEQQKQFIGNASHEIQTPLAICRNRIEMLLEQEDLTEQQGEELSRIYRTLQQISRLNKSLLLLSKIDNGQFPEKKQVDFAVLIQRYLADFNDVYAYKEVRAEFRIEQPFYAYMNETLADILLSNLLRNAFIHTKRTGTILIEVTSREVRICNSGDTPLAEPDKIFDRFYQGEGKKGSSGLGLAIVSSICNLEHLQITYSYENGFHQFVLTKENTL